MKKIDDQNNEGSTQKTEKKSSLFDDSFFEEDDDFDFDDDDEYEEDDDDDNEFDDIDEEDNEKEAISQQPPISSPTPKTNNSIDSNKTPVENFTQQTKAAIEKVNDTNINFAQDIQFRLGCELGQVLIPYENLQNLNIGSVVDFNNTIQTLYLTVNNVKVGEGMLVDIDGKIGIKITRWYGKL